MIIFASRTGNVRHIVSKLNLPNIEISDGLVVNEPFLLFTYTDGLGDTPKKVDLFLERNGQLLRGVIASGNSNFGHSVFCGSANKISEKYDVPIIRKVELRGFQNDYDAIVNAYWSLIGREGNE